MTTALVSCPRCGQRCRSLPIDDTEERILVNGRGIQVAIQIPGCEGYTTAYAARVHQCSMTRTARRATESRTR